MRLLIATKKFKYQKAHDFCDAQEGELVTFGSNSDDYVEETRSKKWGERKAKINSKRYDKAMLGLKTEKATTVIQVAEVDITEEELARLIRDSLVSRGWDTVFREKTIKKWVKQDIADLTEIANDFPEGTILEKDGDSFRAKEGGES